MSRKITRYADTFFGKSASRTMTARRTNAVGQLTLESDYAIGKGDLESGVYVLR